MPVSQIQNASLASGVPSAAKLPAGSVLQVLSTFDSTQYTFNSGSSSQTTYYSIAGLTVNITPSSSSSKILILATVCVGQYPDGFNNFLRLYRGGTAVALGNPSGFSAAATGGYRSNNTSAIGSIGMTFLDSPATTSVTTYSVQICNSGGSAYPSFINRPHAYTGWEQSGSSTITVMEIAA